MTCRSALLAILISLSITLALCAARAAAADLLYLTDGRILRGEVVAETNFTINFRFIEEGAWVTRTFARDRIAKIEIEETESSEQGDRTIESDGRAAPSREGPAVAVLPLHGYVGTVDGRMTGTFDADLILKAFEEAQRLGIDTIILDIDSPGGLISEMEMICDAIIAWHDRLRIIAHTHDALSAAAIIALCCPEIAVRPDSRIGAATIIEQGETGMTAVDAKFASPHYARQRQYMQRSGHPYEVVAAMTIQETELWWSPTLGFATSAPTRGDDWKKVDGASTVLTMTADDALRWGIAGAVAADAAQLVAALELPDSIEVVDLGDLATRHAADLDRRLDQLKDHFTTYFNSLASVNQSMIALFDAQQRHDAETIGRMRREIPREIMKVLNAGQQILRYDRALAARRIDVPESFLQRIEEDGRMIAAVGRLIGSDSPDDWREAGRRLGEVLMRWKQTLDF